MIGPGAKYSPFVIMYAILQDHVFFEAFTDLLLMKLPKNVRHHCMRKMANFMITSAVPCVVQECGQLCSSMIEVDPEAAIELLVLPLMEKILAELPKSQGGIRLNSTPRCMPLVPWEGCEAPPFH